MNKIEKGNFMKYIFLHGDCLSDDIGMIKTALEEEPEAVFVFTHPQTKLFAYIENLRNEGLKNDYLYNLKICYEKQDIHITYIDKKHPAGCDILSISKLIETLDKKTPCKLIVNDDKRTTLADIVQQLIYIGYPVANVNILLKSEAKDEEKVKRFMERIGDLSLTVKQAVVRINLLKGKYSKVSEIINKEEQEKFLDILNSAEQSCLTIKEKLDKAQSVEMKIAAVASKKTGKSMIINSILGEELAPTSLELATPNTLIYKKSTDGKYHLTYEGKETIFDTGKELYHVVDTEFRKAQEDKACNYKIADMEIRYLTEGNNFESFTIFDTPGPDAAGTAHSIPAAAAIEKCDIAVFAIDLTKYLTTSEEDYLRQIKEEFTKNGKFASLIFTINKMDAIYTDTNTAKSKIKSIDFIRNRLGEINSEYRDCIVFATSALQYFRTIECERGCGEVFSCSDDLFSDIRPLIKKIPQYKEQLAWLDGCVSNISTYHSIDNITSEMLKQQSGIPDLLNYVSYIARTKAREEIINNLTVGIDMQMKQIQSIIDYVSNIEKLILLNNDQIESISSIIKRFKNITDEILVDKITEFDLAQIKKPSTIENYINKVGKTVGFEAIKEGVKDNIRKNRDSLPSDLEMTDRFFKKIQEQTYKDLVSKVKEKKKEGRIEKAQLDDILNSLVSSEMLKDIANDIISSYYGEAVLVEQKNINKIKSEIEVVINGRIEQIRSETEKCKKQLEKYAQFYIPKMPDFSFSLPDAKGDISVKTVAVTNDIKNNLWKLQSQAVGKKMNGIRQGWRNFWDGRKGRIEYYTKNISKEDYETNFKEKFYASICDVARDIEFHQHVKMGLDTVSSQLETTMDKFYNQFSNMSTSCKDNINTFTVLIDDREKYLSNIAALERQKKLREEVNLAIEEFSNIWAYVLCGEEYKSNQGEE